MSLPAEFFISGKTNCEPSDVILTEFGVNQKCFADAVESTYYEHIVPCTEHDLSATKGQLLYLKGTRALRDTLVPHKWVPESVNNQGRVTSPDGRIAIAISSGDMNVGTPGIPSTVSAKGSVTRNAVAANNTVPLFDVNDYISTDDGQIGAQLLWYLLVHIDEAHNEIRLELSLPQAVAQDGYIRNWKRRIILDPIAIDGDNFDIFDNDTEEFDFEITQKTA